MKSAAASLPTARFAAVVAKSGRPAVHLTLLAPAKDPALRKLDTQGRILTVQHDRGGTDYGLVGVHPGPGAQLLVFPRSVRRFADRRIVGIKYDLLDEELQVTAQPAATKKKPSPAPSRRPSPRTPPVAAPPDPEPEEAPPSAPLTLPEIGQELRAIDRLLQKRQTSPARERIQRLARAIQAGLDRNH